MSLTKRNYESFQIERKKKKKTVVPKRKQKIKKARHCAFSKCLSDTDRSTNRWTDGQTDKAPKRVTCLQPEENDPGEKLFRIFRYVRQKHISTGGAVLLSFLLGNTGVLLSYISFVEM